ncbi:cytochrome P450 [Kribbella jiaozuonensis]|uniref:Cytochrome P450 n=1 Tax=Kribbella jiaozuonensis TaxID=2575441 RepID=A0A4U3LFR1_9ACTN|nr:cytochrome P450 [Kribbella jiaozuonensis]TKK74251.1 cytochrome P450 [Kribbella jiaozuonensis]
MAARSANEILAALGSEQGRRDPMPLFAELHRIGPVCRLEPGTSPYAVVVNGYDAAQEALKDTRFHRLLTADPDPRDSVLRRLGGSMMFKNEPEHLRMRKVFQAVLTPRRLTGFEPVVEALATELLDDLGKAGRDGQVIDFVDFAYRLPITVIGTFLGIPRSDLGWFRDRTKAIDDYLDLGGKAPERLAAANQAADELNDYYARMLADRRVQPRDDLVSSLVDSELAEQELIDNLLVLVNASFVTTMNLLTNGLELLLAQPQLVDALRNEPARAADCVEEILRHQSSVQLISRKASVDLELGGETIAEGSLVLILPGAANRDPAKHPDADTFDPDRVDLQHLSFGAGPFYCVGAGLARMEGRAAFGQLFQRFPQVELAGEPVRSHSLLLRGHASMPIRLG